MCLSIIPLIKRDISVATLIHVIKNKNDVVGVEMKELVVTIENMLTITNGEWSHK